MFDSLTDRLSQIFDGLKRRGVLSENDIASALREVRVALLEADVALPVVKNFIAEVRELAAGAEVVKSVTPTQMVIKIVQDHLIAVLGAESVELDLAANPPVPLLLVGLQGSGKTTTAAKIGLRLQTHEKKKVLLASLDVYRPAAQEQLRVLGEQANIITLPIIEGQMPIDIAKRALQAAKLQGVDVVLMDTAGRTSIDEAMMAEAVALRQEIGPTDILLVADALTGQDAVRVAAQFKEKLGITGIVLTRIDGDARGGAALSMRAVTGCPIKLLGTGEKLDEIEVFHPERIASRILGMGDVVSLVEKAAETIDEEEAQKLEAKIRKGSFDLEDLALQFRQMRKMGGMEGLMGLLPGVAKVKRQMADSQINDTMLRRQEAIIQSMTPAERRSIRLMNGSRKRRIAAGSGLTVQDVNRLLKQYKQTVTVMKKMGKMDEKTLQRQGIGGLLQRLN